MVGRMANSGSQLRTARRKSCRLATFLCMAATWFMFALAALTTSDTAQAQSAHPEINVRIAAPVALGNTMLLDASETLSPAHEALSYQWTLTAAPAGSTASIGSPLFATIHDCHRPLVAWNGATEPQKLHRTRLLLGPSRLAIGNLIEDRGSFCQDRSCCISSEPDRRKPMTHQHSALRQRMIDDIVFRNMSPNSRKAYVRAIANFSVNPGVKLGHYPGARAGHTGGCGSLSR